MLKFVKGKCTLVRCSDGLKFWITLSPVSSFCRVWLQGLDSLSWLNWSSTHQSLSGWDSFSSVSSWSISSTMEFFTCLCLLRSRFQSYPTCWWESTLISTRTGTQISVSRSSHSWSFKRSFHLLSSLAFGPGMSSKDRSISEDAGAKKFPNQQHQKHYLDTRTCIADLSLKYITSTQICWWSHGSLSCLLQESPFCSRSLL